MTQQKLNLAMESCEDYAPKGHLYVLDDGVLELLKKTGYVPKQNFVQEMISGYVGGFKEFYSLIKGASTQIKECFGGSAVPETSVQKNTGSIDELIKVGAMDSEQARVLLMNALKKQVSETVNKYFAENSYEDNLVTKVKMAYDFAVTNSTLALDKEEVTNLLAGVLSQDQNLETSPLLRNYAQNFVNKTMSESLTKNAEIQGKYSIPRMNLEMYQSPVFLN